jgi:hypothetical protein
MKDALLTPFITININQIDDEGDGYWELNNAYYEGDQEDYGDEGDQEDYGDEEI